MQAIILCGGKGSRFKSVSAKPKILAKFGKKKSYRFNIKSI